MLLMVIFVSGFFSSFLDSVATNFRGGTNLPLPVPWPWVPNYSQLTIRQAIHEFAVGLLYLALPIFYVVTGTSLLLRAKLRANSLLVACTFVGAIYLYYSFDRAHVYYLAWTIPPFVMGLLAVPYSLSYPRKKALTGVVWASLLILSWTSAAMALESYFLLKPKAYIRAKILGQFHSDFALCMRGYSLTRTDIAGDQLWTPLEVGKIIDGVEAINQEFIPAGEGVLIAPYWTTLYPTLGRKSPLWQMYFLFPEPMEKQQRMIEELDRKNVQWAIICHDFGLDDREDLGFRNTHKYVWQHLEEQFASIPTGKLPGNCQLLHRK